MKTPNKIAEYYYSLHCDNTLDKEKYWIIPAIEGAVNFALKQKPTNEPDTSKKSVKVCDCTDNCRFEMFGITSWKTGEEPKCKKQTRNYS